MAFELKQNLKLSQQLIMTPQLQQAIKLLQLSRLELVDTINQEMEENPLLEEITADDEQEKVADTEADGIPVSVSNNTVIRSPKINVITAQTTVSAASGETVVLGGLITKSTQTVERKLPWVGDLPIIGNLFKYNSRDVARTELLIILTPHVVRSREDAERAKQMETARMRWCLRDVHQIHGDIGTEDGRNVPASEGAPVIYPDRNPRGVLPENAVPRGEMRLEPIPAPVPGPAVPPGSAQWPVRPSSGVGNDPAAVQFLNVPPRSGPPVETETRAAPWLEEWAPPGLQRGQFNAVVPVGHAAASDEVNESRRRAAATSGQLRRVDEL